MLSRKVVAAAVVIAVIVAGAYFALPYLGNSKTGGGNGNAFFVSLTDPPNVPPGTTALYVTYSGVQLVVSQSGTESSLDLPGSGTVNVLKLLNSSIVIGTANLPNGTVIKQIKFTISNAVITINGVNDSVVIGEGTLTTNLTSTFSGKEGALVDLVPTVTEIQTVDQNVFVLTPAIKSILAPVGDFGMMQGPPQTGTNLGFNNSYFGGFLNNPNTDVTITNASLVVNGNSTLLSVTVTNHGNTSVGLMNLMLQGQKQVYFPPINVQITPPPLMVGVLSPIPPDRVVIFPNGTRIVMSAYPLNQPPIAFNFSAALTTLSYNNTGIYSIVPPGSTMAVLSYPSSTTATTFFMPPPPTPQPVPSGTIILALFPAGFVPPSSTPPAQQLSFMAEQPIGRFIYPNGTLGFPPMMVSVPMISVPTGSTSGVSSGQLNVSVSMQSQLPGGFILSPGASFTFTLSGELALGPSPTVQGPSGQVTQASPPFAELTAGQSYSIMMFGPQGQLAPYNVTAT